MRRISLAAAVCALALVQCAAPPPSPGRFAFGVMGDVPYNAAEERAFLAMMATMDREPLAFVAHVGDIKGGGLCSDELFMRRKAQFDASTHPFVFTPGDNEWLDCRDPNHGGHDPLERLAQLRRIFFTGADSLGRRRIPMQVQAECLQPPLEGCGCAAHPENRFWIHARVAFVTLNIPGIHVDAGWTPPLVAEMRCRNEANRRWLARAVGASRDALGLAVIIQGNPWDVQPHLYRDFVERLADATLELGKPVLLIHGDTHTYRVDTPLADRATRPVGGLTRVETFGSPFVGWVKVTVDPEDPQLFAFEPRLEAVIARQ